MLNENCKFRLKTEEGQIAILEEISRAYSEMVETCLDKAMRPGIASRRRLHKLFIGS